MKDGSRLKSPTKAEVAALHVLDRIPTDAVPWWAAEWLAAGDDGDSLRDLAGENGRDHWRIRSLLPQALAEMGVRLPATPVEAAAVVFSMWARECLFGGLDERSIADAVDGLFPALDYDAALYDQPLGGLYGLADEWQGGWGRTAEQLRDVVRTACQAQVRTESRSG